MQSVLSRPNDYLFSFNDENKLSKRSWELPKYQQAKKDNKTLEPYQQLVVLSLLNKHCSFTLTKPTKQSKVHITIPRLTHLKILDEEPLELNTFTLQQCKEILSKDLQCGINENTAQKRFEKNKKTFLTNFLMDVALELGFFFDSQLTRRSGRTLQIERINHVYKDGSCLLNKSDILNCGKQLNEYFNSLLRKSKLVTISKDDAEVTRILMSNLA
ncbi:TATA-binding protein-associated phosphoprotein [Entamoeba marina]